MYPHTWRALWKTKQTQTTTTIKSGKNHFCFYSFILFTLSLSLFLVHICCCVAASMALLWFCVIVRCVFFFCVFNAWCWTMGDDILTSILMNANSISSLMTTMTAFRVIWIKYCIRVYVVYECVYVWMERTQISFPKRSETHTKHHQQQTGACRWILS